MSSRSDTVVVVNTTEALANAISSIEGADYLILDSEGLDLGNVGGRISIIILRPIPRGPQRASTIYIVDAITLSQETLQPLLRIIQADSPVKIVYDGRMDYTELNSAFNIRMGKTLDMQIVDILSRRTRQTIHEQMRRLPTWLRSTAMSSPASHADIHNLSSLGYCMKEHGIYNTGKAKIDHGKWLERPLTPEYLHYAAIDAWLIGLLYNKFLQKRLLYNVDELAAMTQRYLTVWNGERTSDDDKYTQHSLLPLNVIDYVDPSVTGTRSCDKCHRTLPNVTRFFAGGGASNTCKTMHERVTTE
ncbi:hypothetical protein ONZ45_g2591 [Pleurotus djamor]|nr:hypothetical protein ONZ45_g2591 [Pleurotus djamor]